MNCILREDGALCLSGYPIRIHPNKPNSPFSLVSDFHGTELPYYVLRCAKMDAERMAKEIDEFIPSGEDVTL